MLKSYFVFASIPYRVLWLILIPLLLLGLEVLLGKTGIYLMSSAAMGYILISEVLSDYFFMGGICADKAGSMKCFHTSVKGRELLRNVLCVDLARRFLYCMIYGTVIERMTGEYFGILMGILLYLVSVAVLNGTRYISAFQIHLLVSMGSSIPYALLLTGIALAIPVAVDSRSSFLAVLVILSVFLAAVLSVMTVKHVLWRVGLSDGKAAKAAGGEGK